MIEIDPDARPSRRVKIAFPQINVTPMIDVLLVLLIIFMIIAPTKPAKFETRIPAKPDGKTEPPAAILMVTLGPGTGLNQTVELNSDSMPLPELPGVLKPLLAERPDKTVFIKASKSKKYEDVVAVIDALKGAGASPIGMQIDYLQ